MTVIVGSISDVSLNPIKVSRCFHDLYFTIMDQDWLVPGTDSISICCACFPLEQQISRYHELIKIIANARGYFVYYNGEFKN